MKQMQEIGVPSGFSCSIPQRMGTAAVVKALPGLKKLIVRLAERRRELLVTAAATISLGLVFLLLSYLFFVQLAAYGW